MNRIEHTQSIISALDEIMKDDQTLQPLQRDVLEQFKSDPENHQTGIFDLATGFGKTVIMSALMTSYLRNNPKGKVIVAVPTRTLVENEADGGHIERLKEFFKSFNQRFSSDELDIGAFYSDKKEPEKQVVITTYSSLNNLRNQINPKEVGLLLLDEAHHTITDKRIAAVKSFTNAAQYGMTATPFYSPEKSLSMVLGSTIAQVDVKKAIQKGLLSNVKNILIVSDISVDLEKELGYKQDYSEEDYKKAIEAALKASSNTNPGNSGNPQNWEEFRKEMAINVAKLYRDYVDENLGALNGKQCMINCRTQEEARIQAEAINTLLGKEVAGWWTTDSDDKTVLDRFGQKKLNVICQVGKLTEGFDDPDIAVCINYPTASQVLEAQRSGRPLHKVQNTSKEALVIDLCFRHPDYDNEVDAIRQNKQQLFMDILGAPVVRCEEIATEKKPDKEAHPVSNEHTTTLPQLHGFHIISNTQELIRLTQEADKLKEERDIPPIRPGMRTPNGFSKEFKVAGTIIFPLLKKAFKEHLTFDTDKEKGLPLVEWVKSGSNPCYALHEKGLPVFIKWVSSMKEYKDLFVPPIRPGMRNSNGFLKEFKVSYSTIAHLLKKAFKEHLTFDTDKEKGLPLVEWVKSGPNPCYALHEKGLPVFIKWVSSMKEYKDLFVPPIRPGMRTPNGFLKEFKVAGTTIASLLKKAFKEHLTFDTDKEKGLPLVEWVKSGPNLCYALHEKGLPVFIKWVSSMKEYKDLFVPPIRPGMRTSMNFRKEFKVANRIIPSLLEKAFDERRTFNTDKEKGLPLVERVKPGRGKACYALHEKGLPAFIKWVSSMKEYKGVFVPPIRPGMRTSSGFLKEFKLPYSSTIVPLLEKAFKERLTFDTDKEKGLPLVEWVRSGSNPCYALHEKGFPFFKELLKNKYGIELKERTTSPTLQSRLKAGSDKGKPKAPPVRKPATPEI